MTTVTSGVRILYIEDDSGIARLLQKSLESKGYLVETATSGSEAFRRLDQRPYDLLLVDYTLPDCSGTELIERLSSRENTPAAVMVTANGKIETAVEAIKKGAADYVVKDTSLAFLDLLPVIIDQVLYNQRLKRERQTMDRIIAESRDRYRRLVELSPDGIVVTLENSIEYINDAGWLLLGAEAPDDITGLAVTDLVSAEFKVLLQEHLDLILSGVSVPWQELRFVKRDGSEVDVEIAGVPYRQQGFSGLQLIFRDITERRIAQQRLEQLAHFDTLTHLPNRALFFDRLEQAIRESRRYGHLMALLFVDLDHFKEINDRHGHDMGDLVLKEAADRLRSLVRNCDTVARMGGDEFTVILTRINETPNAAAIAAKIVGALNVPFMLHDEPCHLGGSVGCAVFPFDGEEAGILLKKADMAMYRVKEKGRNGFRMFSESVLEDELQPWKEGAE